MFIWLFLWLLGFVHVFREGACKKSHVLKLNTTGKFALNIVDNLVVVHHQSSRVTQLNLYPNCSCTKQPQFFTFFYKPFTISLLFNVRRRRWSSTSSWRSLKEPSTHTSLSYLLAPYTPTGSHSQVNTHSWTFRLLLLFVIIWKWLNYFTTVSPQ